MPREFHICDVLSITGEKLVAPRGVEAVYDLLNYMTGDSLFTHQLPRGARECRPWLLKQHPFLGAISDDEVTPENVQDWIARVVAEHGEMLSIEPLPPGEHERIDPVSELVEKIHPDRIVVVGGADAP